MPALPAPVSNVSRAWKGSVFNCVAIKLASLEMSKCGRKRRARSVCQIVPVLEAVNCTGENKADKRCEDADELGLRAKPQAANARPMNRDARALSCWRALA